MAKKQKVTSMFDSIAGTYDFINHLLSMGIDSYWRKRAVNILKESFNDLQNKKILDVATGTADFAIESAKLNPQKIIGIDISKKMLEIGRSKVEKLNLKKKIELILEDAEGIPFKNNSFDAITVGFGVRNFENLEKGISEMYRVLKKNGIVIILEFSKPKAFPLKKIYNFYFKQILPNIGRLVSKNREAYSYLPESVQKFPDGQDFLKIMGKIGFSDLRQIKLTFGIASIYMGKK